MKRIVQIMVFMYLATLFTGFAQAQDPVVYPAKGQSQQQTEKEKFDCYEWAKGQTGFDPMKTPTASAPPPSDPGTSARPLRGAAGGALAGLAIGSLAGEAGKGAAIGAIGGGLIGGARRREHQREQQQAEQQWAEQQAAEYSNKRYKYNRAYGACWKGKGIRSSDFGF